jgi:hypothetical protein
MLVSMVYFELKIAELPQFGVFLLINQIGAGTMSQKILLLHNCFCTPPLQEGYAFCTALKSFLLDKY